MRLIDADALKENIQSHDRYVLSPVITSVLLHMIGNQPTVEAEPVVRCKDCKYRQDDDFCGGRGWPAQLVPDDGYCDRGARMDGDS